MIEDLQRLSDQYWDWLRDRTSLRQVQEWVEITTPYLDRHNDYLQIYARHGNGGVELTDDGYVLQDLEHSGCALDSAKRQSLLKMTLNGFGVQLKDKALEVHATTENFPLRKHNLIQAMLAVNDMFYLASPVVANLFFEDVVSWLDVSDIRYTPRVKFTGKSGYDHLFDFVIPKSKAQPERIVRAINRPGRDQAQAMVFSWFDTREVRPPDARAYAILNDSEHVVSGTVLDALRSYDVKPLLWSQRDDMQPELAA
jgi:hypothetical protein